MPAVDFVHQNIAYEALGWHDPTDHVPDDHLAELETDLNGKTVDQMPAEGTFAWVTKTARLDSLRAATTPPNLADAFRAKLGLLHYLFSSILPEIQLIEVRYPQNAFVKNQLHRPTFLDGAPYIVYRSKRSSDGWGTAVDLLTGNDGLPEAVHRPIAFTQQFEVKPVGWLTGLHLDINFHHLLATAPTPWAITSAAELETFLQ